MKFCWQFFEFSRYAAIWIEGSEQMLGDGTVSRPASRISFDDYRELTIEDKRKLMDSFVDAANVVLARSECPI